MRIKVDFKINDNFEFNRDLNEGMTGFIYRAISIGDYEYAKMLHDKGFSNSGYKKFVYHSYAISQNKHLVKNKLFKGVATLIFSSAIEDTIINFVKGLTQIGKIQVYSHSFNLLNINYVKQNDIKEGIFLATSPICIMDSNHKWLKPNQMQQQLKSNIIQRFNAFYDRLPKKLDFQVEFLNYKSHYIKYKYGTYKGYIGVIAIKGDKELIKLAYESGLGSHTGIGLGLIEKARD